MLGVDVVDIERLRRTLERNPRLAGRIFTPAERAYCEAQSDPVVHYAGTIAAKEAVIKALRLGSLAARARSVEISRDAEGVPSASVEGRGRVAVSISHDGGVAVAVALQLG